MKTAFVFTLQLFIFAQIQEPYCYSGKTFWAENSGRIALAPKSSADKKQKEVSSTSITDKYIYDGKTLFAKVFFLKNGHDPRLARREIRMLLRVRRIPHMVQMEFCVESDEHIFVFMPEYGKDLDETAQFFYRLSQPVQLRLLYQMLVAVQKLHRRGRIHGDIKPRNILFTVKRDGLVLIDLGYSQRIGKETLGYTTFYRPPEEVNEPKDKIARPEKDVWSLAVTIIELLLPNVLRAVPSTGKKPSLADPKNINLVFEGLKTASQLEGLPFEEVMRPWLSLNPNKRATIIEMMNGLITIDRAFRRNERMRK